MRRAKIVATFGPAIANYENTLAVLEAGVDVAPMNMSHGYYTVHDVAGPDSTLQHQPARAIAQAAAKAGLTAADFDLIEIYEAFALVALDSAAAPNIPAEKINANGGAIALGHPIGASGAGLVLHTGWELGRRGTGRRVAALCGRGGQGDAMVLYGADQTRMILVAPDSFKGTYTAAEVAAHIANGIRSVGGTALEMPVADGGEGTFDVIFQGLQAQPLTVSTVGPWGDEAKAVIGLTQNGTAIVELASASGLTMPTEQTRDPLTANTYGTGLLIAEAVRQGAQRILVAAGGSATTDGGAGAITAIEEAGGLRGAHLVVLSDVTTKFSDAARVFGPQKGADLATVDILTQRLERLAETLKRDPRKVDKGGAAGGFAGGMWAQYEASLVSGADYILDLLQADEHIAASEAVIVGEGRLDSQTGQGKIISRILARSRGVPVYAVVGSTHEDLGRYACNFADIITASDGLGMIAAGAHIAAKIR